MSKNVKVTCSKDQRWSFGSFKKGQTIEVGEDIAATMVEAGYGEYFGAEGKQVGSPATENKALDPATENKSEDEASKVVPEIDFNTMTKKGDLEDYAKDCFGVDLDKRKTVKVLIEEIQALADGNPIAEGAE